MIPRESWLPPEDKRGSDRGGLIPQEGVSYIPTAQTQLRASHFGAKKSRDPTVLGISKFRLSGGWGSGGDPLWPWGSFCSVLTWAV